MKIRRLQYLDRLFSANFHAKINTSPSLDSTGWNLAEKRRSMYCKRRRSLEPSGASPNISRSVLAFDIQTHSTCIRTLYRLETQYYTEYGYPPMSKATHGLLMGESLEFLFCLIILAFSLARLWRHTILSFPIRHPAPKGGLSGGRRVTIVG